MGESEGMDYQHDPRHADGLVKDLGLEHGNSVQTPATHDATKEEPEPLHQVQTKQVQVAGYKIFVLQSKSSGHDTHCERVTSGRVKPHATELFKLKRLARYLKRERQWWTKIK